MNNIIAAIIIIGIVYLFVISSATRQSINEAAKNAFSKIHFNTNSTVLGKINCTSNSECVSQYGTNSGCNQQTGNCVNGG